jgi:hypothetical protein
VQVIRLVRYNYEFLMKVTKGERSDRSKDSAGSGFAVPAAAREKRDRRYQVKTFPLSRPSAPAESLLCLAA